MLELALAASRFLTGNWWRTLAIALALFAGVQWARADHFRARYHAEISAHQKTIANYRRAQAEAEAKALKARAAEEERSRENARKTDAKLEQVRKDADARVRDYIARHRVRSPVGGPISGTGQPAEDHGPPSGNGSGADPVLVTVSAEDISICTDIYVRLQAVREWALGL
jgi:membrane protein involved in colicin uptake